MTEMIRCVCCGRLVPANVHVKNQKYCGEAACQRARKAEWQRQKLANDEQYRSDQQEAQKLWRENNPDYWRNYRDRRPDYRDRNRLLQKVRDRRRKVSVLAKMDASMPIPPLVDGTYYLAPHLAKMDAFRQKVHLITAS